MKARTLLAGAGLCVLVIIAIQSADRFLFRQAATQAAARIKGLSFAAINAEPWLAETRIEGLDWRRKGFFLHVGAVRFAPPPFFPLAGAALAGFGAATAEDLTLEAGPSVYKIKRIDLAGASISSADLLQMFDPKNASPLAERLARLSAASIAIPEMTVESKSGTATQTFVYHDILLSGIAQGKAAEASVAGISISIADAENGDAAGAYGGISAKDIDLVLAAKIMSETRDAADAPKRQLFDAVDIDGFHLGGAHGELDARRLTAAVVTGREPLRPWREAGAGAQPSNGAAQRNALFAAFLDVFGFDDLTAIDVRLDFHKEAQPASLTIGRASIPRLDGPRIDGVEAQNLVFEKAPTRVSLETMSFHGLDLEPLTDAEQAPNLLGADLRPEFRTGRADEARRPPRPGRRRRRRRRAPSFAVERFAIERSALADAAGRASVSRSIILPRQLRGGRIFSTLAAMGYERLDLSSRLDIDWSAASRDLAINSFSVDGPDMGSLNVAAQFSNVTPDLASKDERVAAAAARGVLIRKLALHVENGGLVDKAIAVQAKNEKQSVDEARQSDVLRATLLLPALLGNEPPARALGSALAKFIAEPKNFSLQALAPDGVGARIWNLCRRPAPC